MPEISDTELQNLRRLKHVESKLLANPAVRKKFFKVYKEADPQANIPELDEEERMTAAVDEKVKQALDEVAEIKKKLIEEEAKKANERETNRLSSPPFNLSATEIDEVIKYRGEAAQNGELLNLETAARAWIQQHQIPSGRSGGPRFPWSTKHSRPKDDFRKMLADPKSELFKDPRGLTAKMADEARAELTEAFGECVV